MSDPMKEITDKTVEAVLGLTVLERKIILALYAPTALTRHKLYRAITVYDKEPGILDFETAIERLQEKDILLENFVSKLCYLTRPFGYAVCGVLRGAPKLTVITTTGQ